MAEKDVSALSAVRSAALGSDGGSGVSFLMLGMVGLTLAAAALVIRQRRR